MEFAYITKTKNGVQEEVIEVTYTDARYPNTELVLHLTLKDANKLATELNRFMAGIPY